MTEAPSLRTVRVFVASPADMKPERELLAKIVGRLNESMARRLGLLLEFTDWSTHVRPAMAATPEDVITQQIPVETWDVFVGLLWTRFGTPTGVLDPATGTSYASGTQQEFLLAYRAWQKSRKPHLMVYRCTRAPLSLMELDAGQLAKVNEFFDGFAAQKEYPGIFQTFLDIAEFETQINRHLSGLLFELSKKKRTAPGLSPVLPETTFIADRAYEVVAISIDIVKHSEMVRQLGDQARAVLRWFESFVARICAEPQWKLVNWTPDGGLFITAGDGRCDRAALAGIRLLKELELYNLDPANPAKLAIRVAAADGQLVWDDKPSRIAADVLNFTKHLEGGGTDAGEFTIPETLHRLLHESLRAEFRLKPRFRGRRILGYRSAPPTEPPDGETLDHFVAKTAGELKQLARRHADDMADGGTHDATSRVDAVYCRLEAFSRYFPSLDDRWAVDYVERVDRWTTTLLDAETDYWKTVRGSYVRAVPGSNEQDEWKSVAEIVGSRRTGVVFPLAKLKVQTQLKMPSRAGAPVAPDRALAGEKIESITGYRSTPAFEKKIHALLDADDLQEEQVFADLLANDRETLIAAISTADALKDVRDRFLSRLWTLTDLILIEEVRKPGLLPCFQRNTGTRTRYKVLIQILDSDDVPTEELVRARFAEAGLPFTAVDLQVVWRSSVVGTPNIDRRIAAIARIPVDLLWRTVASPNIGIGALWVVAQRIRKESEDVNKIFFDCIHGRLMREVQTVGREFPVVSKLISHFFTQTLFVQSPYFERLDDLLLNFRSSSANTGIAVDLFDKLAEKLKKIREDRGNPQANIPAGIGALPLPVQRHLASAGMYIHSFVLHPDPRIALETLPFITISNVDSLMAYRQINEQLFQEVQKKKEFFVRTGTIMVVLQHPKCAIDFARVYLPKVGSMNVRKVAANLSARDAVRELATRMLNPRGASASR